MFYVGLEESFLFLLTLLCLIDLNECGIGCYVCQSMNVDNPDCEDPFQTNRTNTFLQMPCMTGRKERNGHFPATSCIKLDGKYDDGETLIIRTCALDSGSLTIDTELVRMSHCGSIRFEDRYISGCLSTCNTDGCNGGYRIGATTRLHILTTMVAITTAVVTNIGTASHHILYS